VPVYPLKGQIVRLRLPGIPLEARFSWRSDYFATKSDGMIWAGTTEEKVGFDEKTTEAARDTIITTLARVFPPLMDAEIVHQTACLRPVAEDHLPIVGPVAGVEGLYVATGGARRGIVMSAGMGKIVADLLIDGRTDLDIARFSLDRFAGASAQQG
jgi:glycine/D-amino acid oxidase-like deaminating enzyme